MKIIDLFKYGFGYVSIAKMYDMKKTLTQSVIKRYRDKIEGQKKYEDTR